MIVIRVVVMSIAAFSLSGCAIDSVGLRLTFKEPADSDLTFRVPTGRRCEEISSGKFGNQREKCFLDIPNSLTKGPL